MKPDRTILDTDFYQLASDGSNEISTVIPKGTESGKSVTKKFKIGGSKSDYIAIFYNNVDGVWSTVRRGWVMVDLSSGVTVNGFLTRNSEGEFTLEAKFDGQAGSSLDRDVEMKFRIKTFLFPEP